MADEVLYLSITGTLRGNSFEQNESFAVNLRGSANVLSRGAYGLGESLAQAIGGMLTDWQHKHAPELPVEPPLMARPVTTE